MIYDLFSLGWHSFQQLCLTITRETLGQTVEAFLDSSDAGKDGAFTGTWQPAKREALSGRFVIQCKFTSKRDKTLTPSDVADDVEKARKLVQSGRCDSYVLMTNAGLSGVGKEEIETLFKEAGVKTFLCFGSTWICQQINEHKLLRMLVPRIYGLGDLSQIIDERVYDQAKALLASLSEDLAKVVLTSAYRRAAEALDRHGFVLLVGEPAAGKTTIASMLSIGALDQWAASTLKLDTPEKVVDHWNPLDPSQFFWIDDAFGVTQYEAFLVRGWNHALPMVRTMLGKGAKIVMTSRDYIYNRARNDLKEGAFPLLRESQVVIDVRDLTLEEKEQILYNHMKLGRQERPFRTAIKPYLPLIAGHSRFVPEMARRLGDPVFTQGLELSRHALNAFVEKQERFLQEVLQGLDEDSKAALALIYMRDNALESPVALEESELEAIERLGSSRGGCVAALESLKGSLVQHVIEDGSAIWRFKHPTVGDAYAGLLIKSPELLGIFVHGSSLEKMLGQITCGDVGLERAVVVPKALFDLVLKRLDQTSDTSRYKTPALADWHSRSRIDDFLASRCSKDFLVQYIAGHPDVVVRVSSPGLFLDTVSEVGLAVRLHKLGLLPEEHRAAFVTKVAAYAIDGDDLYAIESARIQSVFTEEELEDFWGRIRSELVPNLANVRRNWEFNCSSNERADEYLEPLLGWFSTLKEKCADDSELVEVIDREISLGRDWIAESLADDPRNERPKRTFGDVEAMTDLPLTARSIFDDVDE